MASSRVIFELSSQEATTSYSGAIPLISAHPVGDRLNSWYSTMLKRGIKLGFIDKVMNMHQTNFAAYNRKVRDDVDTRQAAKNSFVGAGMACKMGGQITSSAQSSVDRKRETGDIPFENLAPVSPPFLRATTGSTSFYVSIAQPRPVIRGTMAWIGT